MSAATVSGLSKVYKHYWGPRSLLKEILLGVAGHQRQWALKEVGFEVGEGEVFGLIGNNGAGKSTLLKILAGTAFPTTGTVSVSGRVSALLELGAGFHPDFSGRENVYFSGALMGLSRDEVSRRETEIVEFSELSEFIDKPVKTYSSGMYLRLGFSVATGFEPDVLIIDEALAVGDQHFQKKCTDRILDFRRAGKTILFCSHNLYQVKTLCNRALWLHRGEVRALGSAGDVVDRYTDYLREDHRSSEPEAGARARLDKEQVSWVEKVELTDAEGTVRSQFSTGETLELAVWARFSPAFEGTPGIGVALVRNDGLVIHTTASGAEGTVLKETPEGLRYARVVFPNLSLLSGLYHFNLVTTDQNCLQAYHITERAASFSVTGAGPCSGVVRMAHQWSNAPRPAGSRPELHDRP